MKRIESAIQAAVIRWVHETYPEIIITATANERSYKETAQIGCIGISDLILFHPDKRVLFLELKKKNGKLSPAQKLFMLGCFHPARDAYGFSHAKEIISAWAATLPSTGKTQER